MEYNYTHLSVVPIGDFVYNVQLNRPSKRNALDTVMWLEIGEVFRKISSDPDCRVVLLTGNGKGFCAGIDLRNNFLSELEMKDGEEIARKAFRLRPKIFELQQAFTSIEECPKPVIAAIHTFCYGAAIDLITACDIRYATMDAVFSIKEVDLGIVSDVGVLSRIGKICGNDSWIREKAFSTREFDAREAHKNQLLSRVFPNKEEMDKEAIHLARTIALKSPIAVQGTKINLNYARDHTVQDSLNFVATWNQSQLFTEDVQKSIMATMGKDKHPNFSKL